VGSGLRVHTELLNCNLVWLSGSDDFVLATRACVLALHNSLCAVWPAVLGRAVAGAVGCVLRVAPVGRVVLACWLSVGHDTAAQLLWLCPVLLRGGSSRISACARH
jgi:hypothetical protein